MGIFNSKKISTQQHLDIEDIRDNLVILKNGKVATVIETSALNFDLLDSAEQDSRIGAFAAFLNSIRFPIQIVIRTQRTDIARYMKLLERYKNSTSSEAIANQVAVYQDFISNLTQTSQILDKRFFTVIPSVQLPIVTNSWVKQLFGKPRKIVNIGKLVQKANEELTNKTNQIVKNYANLGITAKQLKNDELIKLYYSMYEPDKSGLDYIGISEKDIERGVIA